MDGASQAARISLLGRILERLNLRFPTLFLLFAMLTVADLLLPDPIPLLDEIGLALLTLLLGMWKQRRTGRPTRPYRVPPH
ncbi:MAG: IPTL-CTERM sorting domain-containing protein [Nitrospiraceae bacterium]|nr:IPTL-CTERM sorting domain-containing protein [Nitrospiraceae bacterium]